MKALSVIALIAVLTISIAALYGSANDYCFGYSAVNFVLGALLTGCIIWVHSRFMKKEI